MYGERTTRQESAPAYGHRGETDEQKFNKNKFLGCFRHDRAHTHTIHCKYYLNSVLGIFGAVLMTSRGNFEAYKAHKTLRRCKHTMQTEAAHVDFPD